jgi:hypothetical protein
VTVIEALILDLAKIGRSFDRCIGIGIGHRQAGLGRWLVGGELIVWNVVGEILEARDDLVGLGVGIRVGGSLRGERCLPRGTSGVQMVALIRPWEVVDDYA